MRFALFVIRTECGQCEKTTDDGITQAIRSARVRDASAVNDGAAPSLLHLSRADLP